MELVGDQGRPAATEWRWRLVAMNGEDQRSSTETTKSGGNSTSGDAYGDVGLEETSRRLRSDGSETSSPAAQTLKEGTEERTGSGYETRPELQVRVGDAEVTRRAAAMGTQRLGMVGMKRRWIEVDIRCGWDQAEWLRWSRGRPAGLR
ncbi:hypothetical protein M6B38_115375 [Iris pallida]|uniref:Uncharacterized protein n=1 Tax=Iris pallida TaxID=29817 RepID=A0AAX6I514_IRIPA|nr:hypothetical protein M6B38_115370 [Iris pallida]KAJ6847855.1 hypothetical protein M6B38_115375 [Iris pallida]